MRASGRDIIEIFGFSPDDQSEKAAYFWEKEICPFTESACQKTNHDKSIIYGACSVTYGPKSKRGGDVIICPKRFYAKSYSCLADAARLIWPSHSNNFVIGGDIEELRNSALRYDECVVAFGQNSGREIAIYSSGRLSMDWILQAYKRIGANELSSQGYIGIEVQSIDITGNYRENWQAYKNIHLKKKVRSIPNSKHGLNFANVHKRLIPQIIRKGNVYRDSELCKGFFFIIPEVVYKKFEEVIGEIRPLANSSKTALTVMTYTLGPSGQHGHMREVVLNRIVTHELQDIALAFIASKTPDASKELDLTMSSIL
jgi:hypothetical protein